MELVKPKGLIDGFDEDLLRISQEFAEISTNLQLLDFFKYWKDNILDLIFVNRYDPRELLEAIAEMNKLLVSKLDSEIGNNQWAVALYMLLCIYMKQPQSVSLPIRMTMDEFLKVEKSIYAKTGDLIYAWKCLKNMNAIHIAEEKALYGPQLLKKGGNKTYDWAYQQSKQIESLKEDTRNMIENHEKEIGEFESMLGPYKHILTSLNLEDKSALLEEMKKSINQLKELNDL